MGGSNSESNGVLSRTASLLNNNTFSDVEFRVRDTDGGYKTFYAHKLILASAGNEFASLFYSNIKNLPQETPKIIKVLDFTPLVINSMLQYIYCDKLNLTSVEDAMSLFKLARKYGITELTDKCNAYIERYEVSINTLFAKYEYALNYNNRELLRVCRRLVCSDTKSVFEAPHFSAASISVIKDILDQDFLNVSSELDVINAVIIWCKAECVRKGRSPGETLCLRDAIFPLFKYLRFLCLRIDEFLDFVEKHNIFLGPESTKLTMLIMDKNVKVTVPDGFCSLSMPRSSPSNSSNGNSAINNLNPVTYKSNVAPPFDANTSNLYPATYKPNVDTTFANLNTSNFKPTTGKSVPSSPIEPPLYFHQKYESPPSKTDVQNLFPYAPVKKMPPTLKVLPISKPKNIRTFDFPLQEMQRGIGNAFDNDIKCHSKINMVRGAIIIYGIELRVMDLKSIPDECIDVHLCFTGNFETKTDIQSIELKNNILYVPFPEPYYKVSPGNPVDIEVTIEDLKLNRCNVCRTERLELNSGLNVLAEILLKSNQSNGNDSIFFLMSRIMYNIV